MKTLNQITLTAAMIMMSATLTMAGSLEKFEVKLSNGQTLEIISKVEEVVEETIPGYEETIRNYRMSKFEISYLPVYIETPVEEELPVYAENANYSHDNYLGLLLSSISKPEEEVEDNFGFDTKEVFAQIQMENRTELTNGKLAKFIKAEKEVEEDLPTVCAGFLTAK
jgi:hypothetical protein